MGKTYSELEPKLEDFISRQKVFFVSTAPNAQDGHLNLSPKGYDCFRVLSPRRVAYLDYAGSGAETIAHLRENGRIIFMFCAFEGEPNILRLYGKGRVHEPQDPDFPELFAKFDARAGVRSIIDVEVTRVSDSCGYAVPFMDFRAERMRLAEGWENKGELGQQRYQRQKNAKSIDGLPALRWVEREKLDAEPA